MQPKMLFFCELAQGLTQRRIYRLVKRAKFTNNHIGLKGCRVLIASKQAFKHVGEIDDMLFEVAFVVWAKMVIADNGQDGGQGR